MYKELSTFRFTTLFNKGSLSDDVNERNRYNQIDFYFMRVKLIKKTLLI